MAIFLIITVFVHSISAYEKRCPENLEINIYENKCRNPNDYHCLALDDLKYNKYKEECRSREWVSSGNYPVIRGRYIDYEACTTDTYQPKLYWSNEQYKCLYLKSECSELGQLEYGNESAIVDRNCRCDYTKGYDFVTKPNNMCFCIPSEEDCTCYKTNCTEGHKSDYENKPVAEMSRVSICPLIIAEESSGDAGNANETPVSEIDSKPFTHFKHAINKEKCLIVITILTAVSIVLILIIICCDQQKDRELNSKNKTDRLQGPGINNHKESSPYAQKQEEKENQCKENRTGRTNVAGPGMNNQKEKLRYAQTQEEKENQCKENRTGRTNVADIVIIYDTLYSFEGEDLKVSTFKNDVEQRAKEMGYKALVIKLYNEVFTKDEKKSVENILKECRFIFVYMSKSFVPVTVAKNLGLSPSDFFSELSNKITHSNIKIVSACHSDQMYKDYEHILDYFEYKNSGKHEAYVGHLKEILQQLRK